MRNASCNQVNVMRTARAHHRQIRPGFTLIEMVMSLSVMTVLMLGLSGAVMVASRALPSSTDIGYPDHETIDAMNQLRTDLRQADSISIAYISNTLATIALSTTHLGITDGPSMITYTWQGNDRALIRITDGETVSTILPEVRVQSWRLKTANSRASLFQLQFTIPDEFKDPNVIEKHYELHVSLPKAPRAI